MSRTRTPTGDLPAGYRPVALLAVAVLHFVPDDRGPTETMARYMSALAPGSHLAISHTRSDGEPEAVAPATTKGGLFGSRFDGGGAPAAKVSPRFVLPAGALAEAAN